MGPSFECGAHARISRTVSVPKKRYAKVKRGPASPSRRPTGAYSNTTTRQGKTIGPLNLKPSMVFTQELLKGRMKDGCGGVIPTTGVRRKRATKGGWRKVRNTQI